VTLDVLKVTEHFPHVFEQAGLNTLRLKKVSPTFLAVTRTIKLENLSSRIDMQTHVGSALDRPCDRDL